MRTHHDDLPPLVVGEALQHRVYVLDVVVERFGRGLRADGGEGDGFGGVAALGEQGADGVERLGEVPGAGDEDDGWSFGVGGCGRCCHGGGFVYVVLFKADKGGNGERIG